MWSKARRGGRNFSGRIRTDVIPALTRTTSPVRPRRGRERMFRNKQEGPYKLDALRCSPSSGRSRKNKTSLAEAGFKKNLVGKEGFEPSTSCSRSMRADQAALLPGVFGSGRHLKGGCYKGTLKTLFRQLEPGSPQAAAIRSLMREIVPP